MRGRGRHLGPLTAQSHNGDVWRCSQRLINILEFHLHGGYPGEIAHDFHVLVEYAAAHENCLEPIIGHTMSGKPPGEESREDCTLNLPILTVQDRTDPIDQRLNYIQLFVIRVPHVATLCRRCAQYPLSDARLTKRRWALASKSTLHSAAYAVAAHADTLPYKNTGAPHTSPADLQTFPQKMPSIKSHADQLACDLKHTDHTTVQLPRSFISGAILSGALPRRTWRWKYAVLCNFGVASSPHLNRLARVRAL